MDDSSTALRSAQVVLKPEAMRSIDTVVDMVRRSGFDIGPVVANNFAITAPNDTFESFFRVGLSTALGATRVEGAHGDPTVLPSDTLPPSLQEFVDSVVFTTPPDFGTGAG